MLSTSTDNSVPLSRFFLIYPIGLEDLGLIELKLKFSHYFQDTSFSLILKSPGGLEIECSLQQGFLLNSILKTPTRILHRLLEFKSKDAPKLFLKTSKFNWSPWLIGQIPEIESATTSSRLFDSRKITKAIQDGIKEYYRRQPLKKKYLDHLSAVDALALPKIYYRSVNDLCTLSLDTTGVRLHKRGDKIFSTIAPLRENLAALLLLELKSHLTPNQTYSLIDPMCGSATFLIEAHDFYKISTLRDFAYLHTPINIDQNIKLTTEIKIPNPFVDLLGFDQDQEAQKAALANCQKTSIKIHSSNLFSNDEPVKITSPKVVITNPPYGIRIGDKEEINLNYYLKIIESIKNKFAPELLGIIIPKDYKLKSNKLFTIERLRPFKNGGLDVIFYVLKFL